MAEMAPMVTERRARCGSYVDFGGGGDFAVVEDVMVDEGAAAARVRFCMLWEAKSPRKYMTIELISWTT